MLVEDILNIPRPDLVARDDNQVLLAINDVKPAIFIHPGHITGVQVTITDGIGSLFWLLPVASDDLRPFDNQLSHLANGKVLTCSDINDPADRVGGRQTNRQGS